MTDAFALWVGERLLIGSIQMAGLVAMVWLTCRLVPRIPAAAQAALWWLVALKLVLVFAPVPAVPLRVLPANFERQTEQLQATVSSTDERVQASPSRTPLRALMMAWFAALLVQAGRLFLAHRQLRGITQRSIEWTDAETSVLAKRLGLKRVPQVRLSDEIGSPQVFGLWSPVVLMPAETLTTLSVEERSMTLCHELMHVRRRDLVFGWVPACAERLFFFHPLARVAAREYLTAREAACDAAAVRALGVAADDYGRMLIRLGIGNVRPAFAAGGSPFSKSSLKRRLHMLEHQQPAQSSRRWWWVIALIGAAVIPMQLVARTPEAPQVRTVVAPNPAEDPEIYITDVRTGETKKLKIVDDSAASLRVQKDDFFRVQRETELQVEIEKVKQVLEEAKLAKKLEQARAQLELETKLDKDIRVVQKLVEADADQASLDKLTVMQLLEMKMREQRERKQAAARDQEELTQGLQRLAERLERLAAEQQQLADELKRLQRAPR